MFNSKSLTPGQKLYRVGFNEADPVEPTMQTANFVRRNHSWIRLRNTETGKEWNHNGTCGWSLSGRTAIECAIMAQSGIYSFLDVPDGGLRLKRLVRLCVIYDKKFPDNVR